MTDWQVAHTVPLNKEIIQVRIEQNRTAQYPMARLRKNCYLQVVKYLFHEFLLNAFELGYLSVLATRGSETIENRTSGFYHLFSNTFAVVM